MDNTISVTEENLIISKFRELSEDRKQKLLNYVETLYHEEKFTGASAEIICLCVFLCVGLLNASIRNCNVCAVAHQSLN